MVHLFDLFDIGRFYGHIALGNITSRVHPELPLAVANYTPQAQFSRTWDEVTLQCRGLIYNTETLEVVARPFPKFFNWDEGGSPFPPAGPALRMEKMDGSLGILYPVYQEKWNGGRGGKFVVDWGISTRGSMNSEQAVWATRFFREQMEDISWADFTTGEEVVKSGVDFHPMLSKTYLFEIIYPENRVVVDYGDYEGLVLIDVVDNETGFPDTDEFDNCRWPDKVKRIPVPGFDSGQAADIPDNDEGFVYLWPTRNFRTKMKSAKYVELHRLISNLSVKSVWEALVDGRTLDEIKRDLPEEFHEFVDREGNAILDLAGQIMISARAEYRHIIDREFQGDEAVARNNRSEFARIAAPSQYRSYLFAMLDGKSIYQQALRAVKP